MPVLGRFWVSTTDETGGSADSADCGMARATRLGQVALIGFVVPFLVWGLAATSRPAKSG